MTPPAPVHGAPPPPPVVARCPLCRRPLRPTWMQAWDDGTMMAPDRYTCGDPCPGLYRGLPPEILAQSRAVAAAIV